MSSAVKEALQKMTEEIQRLEGEAKRIDTDLAKARAIKLAIERANDMIPKVIKAPKGSLRAAILEVLRTAKHPMTNGQLRTAIRKGGYEYSLSSLHMTKNLIALLAEKPLKIRRAGEGAKAAYVLGR